MIADKQESLLIPAPSARAQWLSWLSWLLTAVLLGIGLWYILQKVTLAAMWTALTQAQVGYVAAALGVILATLWLKAWRWQFLFAPQPDEQPQPMRPLFWSMMLGQYVNLMVPFFRLGEVARLISLDRQTGVGKARTLGTLVVEKTLDIIMLVLTVAVILPFVVLPDFVSNPFTLGLIGGLGIHLSLPAGLPDPTDCQTKPPAGTAVARLSPQTAAAPDHFRAGRAGCPAPPPLHAHSAAAIAAYRYSLGVNPLPFISSLRYFPGIGRSSSDQRRRHDRLDAPLHPG
jgi:hypothetical protein